MLLESISRLESCQKLGCFQAASLSFNFFPAASVSSRLITRYFAFRGLLAQRWEPFPICFSCIPKALLDAPSIGLKLSNLYW
jgi:hypothetical protein